MKKYAPLATLVAVVLLGGALLVANMLSDPANRTTTDAAGSAASAASAAPSGVAAPSEWAAASPAPAAEPPPPATPATPAVVVEKAYTGRSAGNEVTIAIAVKDGKAAAYACDGKKIEAWLEGTLAGGTLTLQGRTSSITATVNERSTLGMITIDGKEWPFSAKGVESPAGLYEGRGTLAGVATRVGWIVDENGDVTGVLTADGTREPAPPLDPANLAATRVDGVPIAVTVITGDATVVPR